jgi:hypothetical protein
VRFGSDRHERSKKVKVLTDGTTSKELEGAEWIFWAKEIHTGKIITTMNFPTSTALDFCYLPILYINEEESIR